MLGQVKHGRDALPELALLTDLEVTTCTPSWVWLLILNKPEPIKRAKLIVGKQKKVIYSAWPHWEEGRRDTVNSPSLNLSSGF